MVFLNLDETYIGDFVIIPIEIIKHTDNRIYVKEDDIISW